MWASNKLEVPVLGNLLMPCNVLELFRRGKKRFAPGVPKMSATDLPLSKLVVTPAEVYDTFSRGWIRQVQKKPCFLPFLSCGIIFNYSFSFPFSSWLSFAQNTGLQLTISQSWWQRHQEDDDKMRNESQDPFLGSHGSMEYNPLHTCTLNLRGSRL